MAQHRIEFDVDFGLAFKESDIKKQAEKHKEKIIKAFQNKEPLDIKFNVTNAIDDKGNPIDEASLKRFTAKYEKQVNSVLKNMMNSFSDKAMEQMSSKITGQLSSTIKELFEEMSLSIQAGIIKMRNDLMTAIGNGSVSIDMSNMIDINDEDILKEIDQSNENIKKELKNAQKELESEYKNLLEEKESIDKKLEKERKKNNSNKGNDTEIKVGKITFNDDSINKIKQDEKKLKNAVSNVAKEFKKATDEIESTDDDSKIDALTERQEKLAHVLLKLTKENSELLSNVFPKDADIDYVDEVGQYFDSLEKSVSWESSAYIKMLEEEAREIENKIKDFEKRTGFNAYSIKKQKQTLPKTDTNSQIDEPIFEQKTTASGREKNITKFNVEPNINNKTLIKKISKAIDIIKEEIKKKPIEVPIKLEPESIGGFLEDIQETMSNYPIDVTINKDGVAEQIKEATKSINIELGTATVSNVSANSLQSSTHAVLPSISDEEMEMYEAWEEIGDDSFSFSAEQMAKLQNLTKGTVSETKKLNDSIKDIANNLEETTEKSEENRETIQETIDILFDGKEIEIVDNQVIKDLNDKIKVYDGILDDLRRKKDVNTTSKPLDGGVKESVLRNKDNKTDADKERLKLLEQERKKRNEIRKEWSKLGSILKPINDAHARIDGSVDGYGKELKELAKLRSKKYLTDKEKERLSELEKQEKNLLKQKKVDEHLIQQEKERLEIAKKTSLYFGEISNPTLLELQKDVISNTSSKELLKRAKSSRDNEIGKNYFSQRYNDLYDDSKKQIIQGRDKKLPSLVKERKELEKTATLWNNVNSLIESKGKEKALESLNHELQQVNKEINKLNGEQAEADQKLKNGFFYPSKHAEVSQEIKARQQELYDQRDNLTHSYNIIKKYSEKEFKEKYKKHKEDFELFDRDINKIKENNEKEEELEARRNKRIDQLRYKDLKSFQDYINLYNDKKQRLATQDSYDKQLEPVVSELKLKGMSEKDAEKTALKQIGISKEYKNNKYVLDTYRSQLQNVELDLNEILRLMQEINILNEELEQEGLSSDVIFSKKKELSGKRLALETLIQRTSWQSNDILGYQSLHNFLNGKSSKDSLPEILSKKADINKYNKNVSSIKEIVDNINVELNSTKTESDQLSNSITSAESKLNSIKETISAKHQNDAQKILEQITELRKQRELLTAEINNTTDEVEKELKKVELGQVDKRLQGLEYRYKQDNNPTLLQTKIDLEYESRKDVQYIQSKINSERAELLRLEYKKKSLELLLEEQEELRRKEEPTSQELSVDKRKENAEYKKEISKIDSNIKKLEEEVSKAQSELDIVSKSAGESLEKVNAELERETENLKNLKNVNKTTVSEPKHSSIYQEFSEENVKILNKQKQDSIEINNNNKKQEEAQKRINNLIESYGVKNEEELVKEIQRRDNFKEIVSLQEEIYELSKKEKLNDKDVEDLLNKRTQLSKVTSDLGFTSDDIDEFKTLNNEINRITNKINNHKRTSLIESLESIINTRIAKGEKTDNLDKSIERLNNLVANDKNEQEIAALKSKLAEKETRLSLLTNKIGKKNALYYRTTSVDTDYADQITNYEKDKNLIAELRKENELLRSSIDSDEKVFQENRTGYISKLQQALTEEVKQYNSEMSESGELTEKAENHLLNMARYMDEIEDISGKGITFSDYGIDAKTFGAMSEISKQNQEMDSNIAKSEANFEIKQQKKIQNQEKIVASLRNQKEEQEAHIKTVQKELEQKQKALELERQRKVEEEERHKAEVAAIDEQRRLMKERIKSSEQTSSISPTDSGAQEQVVQLDKLEEKLKEVNVEAEKASDTISQVNQTNISSEPIKDTFDGQDEYSDKDIIFETDAVRNSQEKLKETVKEVNAELDEQAHTETTTLPPSPIEKQQQELQGEIEETNSKLQEQIALAIQNAQVSIAEGSYVNISGDVHIDDSQWSGIDKITNSAEELLNVVKNIYLSISSGTPQVASQLNAVQAPIENISAQIQQVEGAVGQADVQLKSFGNSIKAVSTGNLDLGENEFKDVQEAVEAMNKALKENATLRKIQQTGDITAKYYSSVDEDGNEKKYVKFNTTVKAKTKDANGKPKTELIKATYVYDVLAKKIEKVENISSVVSDKFTQQEKAMKLAGSQLNYYTSQLDKLLIKYNTFDINDFGIDDDGNLFANVGTRAEQVYDVISGNTKRAIKDVILYRQEVEEAFSILKYNAENGLYTEETFKEATNNFNKMVANFESKMNTVNRNMNTATEKNARSLLGKWQNELDAQISWLYNGDGSIRKDTSILNDRGLEYIEKYKQALEELKILYTSYVEKGEYFAESQVLAWKTQMQTISDIKKEIDSNSSKKYVNGKGYSIDGLSIDPSVFNELSNNSAYARQVLSELAREINGVEVEVIELSKDNKTLTYSFKDVDKNIQTCKLSVDDFGRSIRNTVTKSSQHVGLFSRVFDSLKDKLIQITKYVSAYEIFYKAVNAIKSGIEVVKELDLAMTEMKKVTNESQQALDTFAKSTHKTAQEIGSTASIIQNSAADWMRLGYSIKEAAGLAKNTSILMNVSEFEDIETATESMVAMIQAFKGEGTNVVELSSTLIDKLNNIGNNYSISTSELAESLKRSSGTLIAANNSVDEAIALSVAANALIQDAESTGSALKVISMRIRGTSVQALEEIGEDTEGLIETTSKLQQKVQSLTAVNGKMGVSLLDANGNYRTTYEILQDIADLWNEIGKADIADGQNRQAALLEVLAGKTRAQSLASLLQNGDMLRSVYEDVQNSEGSAIRENEAYMESIQAHLQVLEGKWQELWDNTLAKEQINWVIDRLGNLVDLANSVGGAFNAALLVGGGIFAGFQAFKKDGRLKKSSLIFM